MKKTGDTNPPAVLDKEQWLQLMRRGAGNLGIELDDGQIDLLEAFVRELAAANERLNLTRVVEPAEMADKLLLDSLYPAPNSGDAIRHSFFSFSG